VPAPSRRVTDFLPDAQGPVHQLFLGGHVRIGRGAAAHQLGDVAVMMHHAQAADGKSLSLSVAILLSQGPCFAKQPLRPGEYPGTERGLSQCLVGRRAQLTSSPPRLGCHGRQRIRRGAQLDSWLRRVRTCQTLPDAALDQLKPPGPADRLPATRCGQLAVDVLDVCLDGMDGDLHLAGDLGGTQQAGEVPQHL
jgi:hypothetical protein